MNRIKFYTGSFTGLYELEKEIISKNNLKFNKIKWKYLKITDFKYYKDLNQLELDELKAGVFDYKPMVKPRLSDDEFKDKLHFNVLVYDNLNNVYNDEC